LRKDNEEKLAASMMTARFGKGWPPYVFIRKKPNGNESAANLKELRTFVSGDWDSFGRKTTPA
jgi:hypothetical protein